MRHYAKLLRVTLTASLLLVAMAGAAVTGPLEHGVATAERGDYCASPQPGVAEPDLPLLQDGSARTAFVSGIYKTCLERQRKHPVNTILTPPELGQYCLCYGRAIADVINAEELEDITLDRAAPASFLQKTALSAELCRAKMRPDAKGSAREHALVTVTGECSRTYFPQDTDFAASVVRNKYCACFASRLVDLATTDKLIANELSGGQTPSSATRGVKEIKDYCSQHLQK
jgi:hypothetical protein